MVSELLRFRVYNCLRRQGQRAVSGAEDKRMIFVCQNRDCSAVTEGEQETYVCPNCGRNMRVTAEEELSGSQWSELGIFWRQPHTEESDLRAVECFRNAIKKGDACGMSNLGICAEHGIGIEMDKRRAFWLYTQAAEFGFAPAFYHLGNCYERGIGTQEDQDQAFAQYLKAAEAGYAQANIAVGSFYECGVGREVDMEEAFQW